MIGVILTAIGTFFEEIATTKGKAAVSGHQQSVYTMGFLQMLGGVLLYGVIILFSPDTFVFSHDSLPTFLPRILLEILQAQLTITAIVRASRSTYSFIRILTIPLLAAVDIVLGYSLGIMPLLGIGVIIATIIGMFSNLGTSDRKGWYFALGSALNAVLTLSLYKYNITHFNSVVAEQSIIQMAVLFYFFVIAYVRCGENALMFLTKPRFLVQTLAQGIGGLTESFGMLYAPASVILAAKRSSAMLWAIGSGNLYFHEHHFRRKLIEGGLLIVGLLLLILS